MRCTPSQVMLKRPLPFLLLLFALVFMTISCTTNDQESSSIDSQSIENPFVEFRSSCTCRYDFSASNVNNCDVISYIGASTGFGDVSGNGTGLLIQFDPDILSGHVMGPNGPQPCDRDVCFGGSGLDGINMVIYNPNGGTSTEILCNNATHCTFEVWDEYYEIRHDYNEIFIDWDCDALKNLEGSEVEFCIITECPCLAQALDDCPFSPYGCFSFKIEC